MNEFRFSNTPENLAAAKRLFKKYSSSIESWPDGYADYYASLMVCALCDSVPGSVDVFGMDDRLTVYGKDSSSENQAAFISGMRLVKPAYLSEPAETKGKAGKPLVVRLIKPGEQYMPERHLPGLPLYTSKHKRNTVSFDCTMHETNVRNILKICHNAGVDYVYPNPGENKMVISVQDIETVLTQLEAVDKIIQRIKKLGVSGDELFYPLMRSFNGCRVRCEAEGIALDGIASGDPYDRLNKRMRIMVTNPDTEIALTVPAARIKLIREIDPRQS